MKFDKAYVQIKVNNKKMNVALPKELIKAFLKPIVFNKAMAKIHNKLGQSIPIVNHKIKQLIKMNITPLAS